jgi:PPM family protein phosphatase
MSNHDAEGPLLGGRYRLVATRDDGTVELLDTQPWRRCWSCGTPGEQGQQYCDECGANLTPRRYLAEQTPIAAPQGAALLAQISDPAAHALLPTVWDSFDDGEQRYTVLAPTERPALTTPLDELQALAVGRDLARLLATLHGQELALGPLAVEQIALDGAGSVQLLRAPGLRADAAATKADLRHLASLLEALTATPRVTQRFDAEQADTAASALLPGLLRELRTDRALDAATLAQRLDALVAERTPRSYLARRLGASTHKGQVRDHNEDSYLTLELKLNQNDQERVWGLYVVSDGMGGHAAGEVASDLAIRGAAESVMTAYLVPTLGSSAPFDEAGLREVVRAATQQANTYVVGEARARGNDMGATLTLALVVGDKAYVANVGDSRTYLLRGDTLRRVSKDHSLVMRLVDLGQISYDDIYSHPQRSAILRSLGDRPEVEVDVFVERLRPGDTLFLCSDGQWEMTRDDEMARLLHEQHDPQAIADALIDAANAAGGEDNITAVVVQFVAEETL